MRLLATQKSSQDNGNKFLSIRIRPELRAAQVKRSRHMVPALTLYFDEKYDLGATEIPSSFRQVSLLRCIQVLAFSDAQILEVPEPLWMRFMPKNVLLLFVWKFSGFLRRQPKFAVTYAIENNELSALLSPNVTLPPMLVSFFRICAGKAILAAIDRIAYGSDTSRILYQTLKGVSRIPSKLVVELPSAAQRYIDTHSFDRGQNAIFIGEMDDRKGILDLMLVWPSVEKSLPQALLRIVGGGKYAAQVQRWCEERPDQRIFAGVVPHGETSSLITSSSVLVAPSKRFGRWREQIGLPIVEALACGLTVVTTDESGLAPWLSAHGHKVVPQKNVARDLAAALSAALEAPLKPQLVLDDLPVVPGRIRADHWLHRPFVPVSLKDES